MSARTWWSAKAGPKPAEKRDNQAGDDPDLGMDELLDARFDEAGRLSQIGHGRRQRIADRLDPRPAEAGFDELDLAVRKLSEGLEAIERQSRTAKQQKPDAPPAEEPPEGGRDFVTYSLDRLEARLEALSKRLQQRTGSGRAASTPSQSTSRRLDPSLAISAEAEAAAQLAEARRLAEAEEARRIEAEEARRAEVEEARRAAIEAADRTRRAEEAVAEAARREAQAAATEERRQAEIADAKRQAEMADARRQAELAEARRQSEVAEARRQAELAEARRQAEMAEARREAELAEAQRRSEMEAVASELRRQVEEAEAIRLADIAEVKRNAEAAEARHRAEAAETLRQAEIAAARREAEKGAIVERQFAEIEGRIEALQRGLDDNQVEPVREELLDLVQQMTEMSRGGRATAGALDGVSARLDEMEVKINAARNMAGNRLGDIQDRLVGLVERIDEIEVEIPGFDAIRVNQSAILERFDRMEGLVERLSSADELLERIEGLKRQMQTAASQKEVGRIEEQILKLADRLDALPEDMSDKPMLEGIEGQLGALATEFAEARRQRKQAANEVDERLAELSAQLRDVAESGRTPDLSGIEDRISRLASQVTEDRQSNGDMLGRLERQLGALASAIEQQEGNAAVLEGLTHKVDSIANALDAQDAAGARRDIESLGRRLEQVAEQLSAQAEHLSRRQVEPLAARLDEVGSQLEELSRRAADQRALQAQIESIISRLEVLKGRSVDPARLNDLFERVDIALRAIPEDRFDRLEERLKDIAPADRFDRLEKKIAETAAGGATAERISGLERKLDEIGRVFTSGGELLTQEDLTDLRSDIVALRRELRSLPGFGQGETSLGEMMRTIVKRLERLPQDALVTTADLDAQMERIARILEDPAHSRAALTQMEAGLKSIEERLDETRRALEAPRSDEDAGPAGLARALSDDVSVLKSSTQASERKTRDAIDAVQGTLEAVVKRMAFLERDTGAPAVARSAVEQRAAPSAQTAEEAADQPPASLLSRLTSRQLLRRATGGRAESFSPEPEESDEGSDIPLEPGTDAPLSSTLSGAPSSNTEFMSGARKGRVSRAERGSTPAIAETPAGIDDDFLAAARRAARAAAKEATESDDETPVAEAIADGSKSSRGRIALIAAAIAAAIAVAALFVVRPDMWPGAAETPTNVQATAPATEPEALPAPEISAAPLPEMTEPEVAAPSQAMTTQPADEPEATSPSEVAATAEPTDEPEATPPQAELRPEEPLPPANADEETAAASPAASEPASEAPMASDPSAAEAEIAATEPSSSEALPLAPTLPEEIGSDRLRDAATAGDPVAAFEVAARYAEGRGVLPDMATAVIWYERAANVGLAPAQYRLGSIYEKGLGVPKDLAVAQKWYQRAADAGNVKAMHNLAVLFAEGAGGEPDLEHAADLFRQAAERGVRDSQFNLAILHARGLGVPQDLMEAYKWFGIAASSGDAESAKRRDIIGEALSEDDRAKAEEAVATFQPTPLASEANEVLMPDGGWSDAQNSTSVEVQDQNELVALVQRLLAENGFDPGPPDGMLGRKTTDAIAEFQSKAGLPKTGKIDNALVAALQAPAT